MKIARLLALHAPLLTAALLAFVFSADLPLFRPLKTEATYGLWVVVLVPLAILLFIVQVFLWVMRYRWWSQPGELRDSSHG